MEVTTILLTPEMQIEVREFGKLNDITQSRMRCRLAARKSDIAEPIFCPYRKCDDYIPYIHFTLDELGIQTPAIRTFEIAFIRDKDLASLIWCDRRDI